MTSNEDIKSNKSLALTHKKLVSPKKKSKESRRMTRRGTLGGDKARTILNSDEVASLVDRLDIFSEDNDVKHLVEQKAGFLIFRVHNKWRLRWEFIILLIAVWNGFSVPYNVAFYGNGQSAIAWEVINILTDIMFFLDLLVNFRTTYTDSRTQKEIFDAKKIAIQYLKGRFWIDFIATVPIDYVVEPFLQGQNNSIALKMIGLLKLVRVLRLSRLITFMNLKDDIKMSLKLVKLIFFLVLYLHMIACLWFFIVKQNETWFPPLGEV